MVNKNYKRLGDYIQRIDSRNSDSKISYLVGLSITKEFIPSVANIIGTDLSKYKVIRKNQFACSLMQVSRDEKIPIAKFNEDKAIMSPAYPMFEVIDESILLPDYLMMWFSRSEFDREASYYAVGGVRGSLEWNDFCNMELPIPSIEKQREIVAEYQSIANKIKVNEQICEKLEATAHALYKHWFVDFEFPNEDGLPYKSSDGEMVFNEELEKEVPEGWEVKRLGGITKINAGGDKPIVYSEFKTGKTEIPIFSNGVTNDGLFGFTNKANYPKNSITISARGTIGFCVLRNEPFDAIVRLLVLTPKNKNLTIYLWHTIKLVEFDNSGSVQNQLTKPQIENLNILIPTLEILEKYQMSLELIYNKIDSKNIENQKLSQLQSLLLSRLAKRKKNIKLN